MNENVMSRTKAREIALHLIFEMGFRQFEPENLEERICSLRLHIPPIGLPIAIL